MRTPHAIDRGFYGERLVRASRSLLENERARRAKRLRSHTFDSAVWKKAKAQLLAETHGKCAYCETPAEVVDYVDVEHFRPKSTYWWLAYCLDNYLASCAICNQRFKRDAFPIDGQRTHAPTIRANSTDALLERHARILVPDPLDNDAVDAHHRRLSDEASRLIDPYVDDPQRVLGWHADMVIEEVELRPAHDTPESARRVRAIAESCGLDRIQLRRNRYFTFQSYYTHKRTLLDATLSDEAREDNERMVANMMGPERPYAGMIRFFEAAGTLEDWVRCGYLTVPML